MDEETEITKWSLGNTASKRQFDFYTSSLVPELVLINSSLTCPILTRLCTYLSHKCQKKVLLKIIVG